MSIRVQNHPAGFKVFQVGVGDSEFELSTFGGQLLSWEHAGKPILFANRERAIVDGKTAYRGGSPVCFPYFGKGILLPSDSPIAPQHGSARTSIWESEVSESESRIILRNTQPTPEGFGPTMMSCELTYDFSDGVTITAKIENVGDLASPVQCVLHSYWATSDLSMTKVIGLGAKYLDNLTGYSESVDPQPNLPHQAPFDRVYPEAAPTLDLSTNDYNLRIETSGCNVAVFWNPGADHGIKDLGEPNFICVESGLVTPTKLLEPGETTSLSIRYRVS